MIDGSGEDVIVTSSTGSSEGLFSNDGWEAADGEEGYFTVQVISDDGESAVLMRVKMKVEDTNSLTIQALNSEDTVVWTVSGMPHLAYRCLFKTLRVPSRCLFMLVNEKVQCHVLIFE